MGTSRAENSVFTLWKAFSGLPGGRFLFHQVLGRNVPYATSISPTVEVLGPGHAIVSMGDRRSVRNQVQGVHAAAILNLAENTAGLAVSSLLPEGSEPVVKRASIEHRKKAVGPLVAECKLEGFDARRIEGQPVEVLVRDQQRHIVAEATIVWELRKNSATRVASA